MSSLADAVRPFAEAHGAAVVSGDMAHVVSDIAPALHPQMGQVGAAMPAPTTAATVESLDDAGDAAVAVIRYEGADRTTRIRSTWRQVGDRPLITDLQVL